MAVQRRINLPVARGLTEVDAAAYCGVELATFRRLVDTRVLPAPLPFGGRTRVYDRKALDTALDRISFPGGGLAADIEALDRELGCHDA